MFGFSDGGSFKEGATSICDMFASESDSESQSFSWAGDFGFDSDSLTAIADFIDSTAESSTKEAIGFCLENIGPDRSESQNALLALRAFSLQEQLDKPEDRLNVLERIIPHAETLVVQDKALSDKILYQWNNNIRQLPDKEKALERSRKMGGFSYDDNNNLTIKERPENICKAASMAILDSIDGIKGDNPTRQILDMMVIPPDGSPYYHDMLNMAARFLPQVKDKNEMIGLALNILKMDEHGSAARSSALAIAENITRFEEKPARKMSLLKTAAKVFAPKSEPEIRIANKWAEIAMVECARGTVPMQQVLTEITRDFPAESHMKEQADMMAASLASVQLKSDYIGERETGLDLARHTMKSAVSETPKSMATRLVLYNSDLNTSFKEQAALAHEALQNSQPHSEDADHAVEILLDNLDALSGTTRFAPDAPSENDLRLLYAYDGACKVTESGDLEVAIVGHWMEALDNLPQREKVGHLIQALQENQDTSRDSLIYIVAWEKYDALRQELANKAPQSAPKRDSHPSSVLS